MRQTFVSQGRAPARPEPVDRDPRQRPGVPMMTKRSAEGTSPSHIPQQQPTVPILVGVEVGRLPPIFGTTLPPKGLSGLIRRAAYKIPEHKAARWILPLLADRVEAWGVRLRQPTTIASVLGVAGLVVGRRLWSARRAKAARASRPSLVLRLLRGSC